MRDDLTLFLILWAIYAAENWVLTSNRSLLVSLTSRRPPNRPGSGIGNARWRLSPLLPLPLYHLVSVASQSPLALAPRGISSRLVQNWATRPLGSTGGQSIRYENAAPTDSEGSTLRIRGKSFARCDTETEAKALHQWIDELRDQSAETRSEKIRQYYQDRFPDTSVIEERIERLRVKTNLHRVLSSVLAVYSLLLFPLAYYLYPSPQVLLSFLLSSIFGGWILTGFYFRTHRSLYPEEKGKRFQGVLKQVFCFPVAMGASKDFSLYAFADIDPLALSHATLPEEEFLQIARTIWLDLEYPLIDEPDPIVAESREILKEVSAEYLTRLGLRPTELSKALEALDSATTCYCPRCHSEFNQPRETCSECPGVAVISTQ
ncbi:hypothetical protein [Puniceicoccus vermicola]|uniref:Uncharacterized protein n=1 Tax=Puniceicoccus vermicola TaxID=388746 RepID=A0A7X1B147_9BACT|nr:hypothetical protein [Puniceicoccus vermicola]MBC2603701.1 hypothetical protein [Puniceicoccus vermicola]